MPCYHPRRMSYKGTKDDGTPIYVMEKGVGWHVPVSCLDHPKDILVPCKKCIGCRLDYSRKWADRLVLELDHTNTALFFTLTYDDEHLTLGGYSDELLRWFYSLNKRDLQLFNKRLRFHFAGKEIRFYASGEYGDKTLRPHYHGIYFGLSLGDFGDVKLLKLNKHCQPLYYSETLNKIWSNGFVTIGNVSWQSCAYVARYNLKKLKSGYDGAAEARGCISEFSLMSRNPGIAGYFPIDHPDIFDDPRSKIVINDKDGLKPVSSVGIPNYIFDRLRLINPELYDKIKSERAAAANDSFLLELSQTDLDEPHYQRLKESRHEKCLVSLVRDL